LNLFASEVSRVAHNVGTEGKLGAQAKVQGADGIWKELTDNVNTMAANLTNQVRDIAQVSKSVARGDLTKKVTVEVRGEMLDLKNTINTMVDQVSFFRINLINNKLISFVSCLYLQQKSRVCHLK
jgi:HAMP domain-containing protein